MSKKIFSLIEAFLIFSLGMLYIWVFKYYFKPSWVAIIFLIFLSHIFRKEGIGYLGFSFKGFKESFKYIFDWLPLIFLSAILVSILSRTMRPLTVTHIAEDLSFYFFWALFQQYVLNGYFANRLYRFFDKRAGIVPLACAIVFSLFHLPNPLLMVITLFGGYFASKIYLKYRDLYSLAVAHALIGFLIHITIPYSIGRGLVVGPGYFK